MMPTKPPKRRFGPVAAAVVVVAGSLGFFSGDYTYDAISGGSDGRVTATDSPRGRRSAEDDLHLGGCSARRGGPGGRWEQNMQVARKMQYSPRVKRKVAPNKTTIADRLHKGPPKYRLPTTFVWRDNPDIEDECGGPVAPLSGESFCDVAMQLGLDRVLFVGDSLSWFQFTALMMQIGAVEPPKEKERRDGWSAAYDCAVEDASSKEGKSTRTVLLGYVRNDWLVPKSSPLIPPDAPPREMGDLTDWSDMYLSGGAGSGAGSNLAVPAAPRTLLVVNTGAHYGKEDGIRPPYRTVLDTFLTDVRAKYLRPNDVVILRTTPLGHPACQRRDRPFASVEDHEAFLTELKEDAELYELWKRKLSQFGWDKFEGMNEDVRGAVRKYNAEMAEANARGSVADAYGPAEVHILDVAHMTNLRPDGHISGVDNKDPDKKNMDCLHYSLPGPIDWWNNLLFANLADLARPVSATATAAAI